ncbi:MAG: hypothetical protein K2X93_04520 [Candidatus Obscuribacterales bacterium]|nr:hypothetical protein [Candidatus Obscuribacterales bacterium]
MDSDGALFPATFSISKKPSLQQRLFEARPIVLFFLGCFVFGFLLPPLSLLLGTPLLFATGNYLLFILGMILLGGCGGLAVILAVRYISRGFLAGDRKRLKELETKISTGASSDVVTDLDKLITENLKMGRPQVAEYYSKQLLTLCERGQQEGDQMPALMWSTPCWVSSPEYHKSFNYWVVWLFESRGLLCLTNEHLEYESSRISFRIALEDIVDIGIDRHPWWMKPYPLNYIKLSFKEFGETVCLYATPYTLQTDTVWDINKTVREWYNNLTKALQKVV